MGSRWPLSNSPLFDLNGQMAAGALIRFYEAGTTTPMAVYRDAAEATPHPNPAVASAIGTAPLIFIPYRSYGVRVTSADGALLFAEDNVPNVDPATGSGGGGGGGDVSGFQTGDVLWLDRSGTRDGWVRDNGRTIGNATSGATERANADTEALYTYLWNTFADSICPVSGGRGASAATDYAASKTIGLPDKRGRSPFGLDDMGNTAAGRFPATVPFSSGNATTPGALGGEAQHVNTIAEIPSHSHGGATTTAGAHAHTYSAPLTGQAGAAVGGFQQTLTQAATTSVDGTHLHGIAAEGGGGAHNNTPLFVLGTFYRKL